MTDQSPTIDIHEVREETYERKLRENLQLKRKFLEIGTSNLSQLSQPQDENDTDDLLALQKETISLYESLKTIPFKPQRDDLIGMSLADYKLNEQVENLQFSIDNLQKLTEDTVRDLKYTESLIYNLNLLNNVVIGEKMEQKAAEAESQQQHAELDLPAVLESYERKEGKLITYVKQVIFKYLVELNNSGVEDRYAKRTSYLRLVEDLLNNVTNNRDAYIEVPRELRNDAVLRQLLLGNVISQKQNFQFIKLNGFGL